MSADSIKGWEASTSTGRHFDVLDGIRGVAILMVVARHTFYANPASGIVLRAGGRLMEAGWMGVPLFFVLSGFLISYPFFRQRAQDTRFWYQPGYARRRIGKIAPPFYLSIVLFTAWYLLQFGDPAYLRAAGMWALGLPNFIPVPLSFNAYWSLVVEVHFYILLPLLFFLTRGLKLRPSALCLFAILFAVPLLVRHLTWPAPGFSKETITLVMERFPCQLDYFAWGVLFSAVFVALTVAREELRALGLFGYAGFALLAVSAGCYALWSEWYGLDSLPTRWSTEVFHLLPAAAAFLLLFFVFDPACTGARVLSLPPLRFVGLVSYEWFLFHFPLVVFFRDKVGHTHGSLPMYAFKTLAPLALSFGISVLVYRHVSLPLMNRIRGKGPGRLPTTAAG
jgi:peptidoglycan/LPS O-acetylase OafA/YrhL